MISRVEPIELSEIPDDSDRYNIIGSIHRGGMGEILLARIEGAEGFSRKVVLKGLLSKLSHDSVSYQLFMREARLMARLDHPNVVRVFDLPFLGGKPYLAMEYVRGRNFHQVIQRASSTPHGLPLRIALFVVAEALRGLHYAHNLKDDSGRPLGIIHRDVSPGNILVSFFGEVKMTDFGIAKAVDTPKFTQPRSIRGKARYVAPEQVHGEPATIHSDTYSAGVVLAESIMGEPLWERNSVPETLLAIVGEDRERTLDRILRLRAEVPGLRSALRGALELSPRDRFASALQFAETLEAIAKGMGGPCGPVELGMYMRRLFSDAPDLPTDDGFGASGLPVPKFPDPRMDSDPTIVALEPAWLRQKNRTQPMRPRHPDEPISGDEDTRGPPVRDWHGPKSASIRAVGMPEEAAILGPPSKPAEDIHEELSFSELIPHGKTDEEQSRELKLEAIRRHRRRRGLERPVNVHVRPLTLLVAGILIGAALAISGCVLAILLSR